MFKIKDSPHLSVKAKPKEFYDLMNGFFDGSIIGRFEEKPLEELAFKKEQSVIQLGFISTIR